jgi:hypothetical protein
LYSMFDEKPITIARQIGGPRIAMCV